MHWVCAIAAAVMCAWPAVLLWRRRSGGGETSRRGVALWAGSALVCAAVAWLGSHAWVPQVVDTVRWVVGFEAVNDLERGVYSLVDERVDPSPGSGQSPLRWSAPGECVSDRAAFSVARAPVDPTRPGVQTSFIAMDMTRLRLHILADGAPPPGAAAVFNGAFQAAHGAFGIRVSGQTLLPPIDGAATVGVDGDGRVRLFAWSREHVEGDWVALRQNLELLVDTSRAPPVLSELTLVADGRQQRIGHAPIRRSGLCVRGADTLVYVWSSRATAQTLGDAMLIAGCERGMHLDANTFHTRFEFIHGDCVALGDPAMTDGPRGRFLAPQTRDFFAVTPAH